MTTMFNLGDILQLVMNGFDQYPIAPKEFVVKPDQERLYILADRSEQLDALLQ